MSYRTFRWPLALAVLLTIGTASLGQPKPTPTPDKWDGTATGTAVAALITTIKVELKGKHKELTLISLAAKYGKVAAGAELATIASPDHARALVRAEQSVTSAKNSLTTSEISLEHAEKSFALQRAKADRDLATATAALKDWNDWRKKDRIRSSELGLISRANSIKDQEEELAQLERLYRGNDLAKESQDIVLNRSKRRLESSKERYEMSKRNHKKFLAQDIPNELAGLKHTLSTRTNEVDRLAKLAPVSSSTQRNSVVKARNRLEDATRTRDELAADMVALTIKAPHDGVLIAPPSGPMGRSNERKVGDKVSNGSALLRVMDASTLTVRLEVPAEVARRLKVGATVQAWVDSLEDVAEGKIRAIGVTAKKGKLSVEVEVANSDLAIIPGLELNVKFEE